MRALLKIIGTVFFGIFSIAAMGESGESVIVVFNSQSPESKDIASHYAERRHVPAGQVFGLKLPTTETMTRAEYRDQLQKPLLKLLEEAKLWTLEPIPATKDPQGDGSKRQVTQAKIRYAVLCYGVPLRILHDPAISEQGMERWPEAIRVNGAAVDSELATLPLSERKMPLTGPLVSPFYGVTNAEAFTPTNGLLMVARLDGPTAEVARGLVDKAIQAERDGLWGRAYFDLRGLTNGDYKMGDDWLRAASQMSARYGFETVVDEKPETLPASFPMSQIALYAGWYSADVCGPFAQPKVEFMPGAFAYHLYSFSAKSLRTTNQAWVGPLLASGATATMGCVDEPLLEGTPDMQVFFGRWLGLGFSFGEAAYAAQKTLSWQTTVVGDPLYRPFAQKPKERFEELASRKCKLVEWSHLQVVNINLATGLPRPEAIDYLKKLDMTGRSAVLSEKLADLYAAEGKNREAIEAYSQALKASPTPQQEIRLSIAMAEKMSVLGKNIEAATLYEGVLKKFPNEAAAQALTNKVPYLVR